ncbi:MAG: transcription antitermination factor NusB [Leptospiraceae bacterium]|nr:transcription antitermination factor NusB [Leptospiraceae bacterium]MCP5503507.1 transcription antitermination factor NusB [Leptospiraceae bacterium]
MASRAKSRSLALQALYQYEMAQTKIDDLLTFRWYEKKIHETEKEYSEELIKGVVKNWELLDTLIKTYTINWGFERISIINRNILRLSIYSLINQREIPPKVIINEAIELARKFDEERSVSFINGILDAVYKDEIQRQTGDL